MNGNLVLETIRGGLIVSCQALKDEPLYGADIMARMALAAKWGGAVAIRANGAEDIRSIKPIGLPVIGIVKQDYPGTEVYITPTLREVDEIIKAGADIVAIDATQRQRPDGSLPDEFIQQVKQNYLDVLLMADVSTFEEGVAAAQAGVDMVASTMSGYTDYSPQRAGPDFTLIERLAQTLPIPVIAEGRVRTPEEAVECLRRGAWAVVVGSAITRPQEIVKSFTERILAELKPHIQANQNLRMG